MVIKYPNIFKAYNMTLHAIQYLAKFYLSVHNIQGRWITWYIYEEYLQIELHPN